MYKKPRSLSIDDEDKRVPLTPKEEPDWMQANVSLHDDSTIFHDVPPPLPNDDEEVWDTLQTDYQSRIEKLEFTIHTLHG